MCVSNNSISPTQTYTTLSKHDSSPPCSAHGKVRQVHKHRQDTGHRETGGGEKKTTRFTKSTYHLLHGGNRLRAKERNTEGQRLERQ